MPINLVPLGAEHLPALQGLITQAELAMVAADPNTMHHRAVFDGENCVGTVGLNRLGDPQIVVAILPAERRKGYATAAVNEMARFAFEELDLPEIYAMCEHGRPSNELVRKAGYIFVVQQEKNCFYRLPKETWQAAHQAEAQQAAAAPPDGDDPAAHKPAEEKEPAKET